MKAFTSVEDKSVNTHILIMADTNLVNQTAHVTQAAQSCHEVTVPLVALNNIARGGSLYEKLRVFEYVLSFDQDTLLLVAQHPRLTVTRFTAFGLRSSPTYKPSKQYLLFFLRSDSMSK